MFTLNYLTLYQLYIENKKFYHKLINLLTKFQKFHKKKLKIIKNSKISLKKHSFY